METLSMNIIVCYRSTHYASLMQTQIQTLKCEQGFTKLRSDRSSSAMLNMFPYIIMW